MAKDLKRRIDVSTYSANKIETIELPRNHIYKTIWLFMTGTVTVSSAGSALVDGQPFSLLKRIRLIRNGHEVIKTLNAEMISELARVNHHTSCPVTALAGAGVQTDTVIAFSIPIDLALEDTINPSATLLRAVGLSSLDLELTWGTTTDLITGGTVTIGTATQIIIEGHELLNVIGNFGDYLQTYIEKSVTATATDFEIDLPLGNMYRRLVLVGIEDGAKNNDVIGNVELKSDGTLIHVDSHFDRLRDRNKVVYGNEAVQTGYAFLDFAEDGNPQGFIDTLKASSFKLKLSVTAGTDTKVQVILEQVIPAAEPVAPAA